MIEAHKGSCEHCTNEFRFELIHNGLNQSAYAYCNQCGMVALLDVGSEDRPGIPRHRAISAEGEALLSGCSCGGRFRSDAVPRCPKCRGALDAAKASEYINAAIQPVAAGWKWQSHWHGLYCMVVEKRFVRNNWKSA